MPSIFIATPMYGARATAHYVHSFFQLQKLCHDMDIELRYQFLTTESLITRGRNSLARAFLDSNLTHLMFIDADIAFRPQDVLKLVYSDLEIACGLYPMKYIDWEHVKENMDRNKSFQEIEADTSPAICNVIDSTVMKNGIVEVRESGTGFMCISRQVLEKMIPVVPHYRGNRPGELEMQFYDFFGTSIDPETGMLLSEDYHFCHLWRRLGGKIHAITDINLQHIGDYVYSNSTKYVMPHPH